MATMKICDVCDRPLIIDERIYEAKTMMVSWNRSKEDPQDMTLNWAPYFPEVCQTCIRKMFDKERIKAMP
jgi:hypothetical protein